MRLFWTPFATVMMSISALITWIVVIYLRSSATRQPSCLRWLFGQFFVYLAIWSVARAVSFGWLWHVLDDLEEDDLEGETTFNQFDRLGSQAVLLLAQHNTVFMSAMMCAGDAALMGVASCSFPLAHELCLLARQAMDGGPEKEQAKVNFYSILLHSCVLAFLVAEALIALLSGGYSEATHRCKLFVYALQMLSLGFVAISLLQLKCTGRKFEPVQGVLMQSPLYMRLKRIMFVYCVFTCQFQLASLVLTFSARKDLAFLATFSGISLVLYCSTGLALAVTTACSQLCLMKVCACWMPRDLETELLPTVGQQDDRFIQLSPIIVAPTRNPVFVYTDIKCSSALWGAGDGKCMQQATEIHDDIIRAALTKYHGYEITTCGDAFHLAFHSIRHAIEYCIYVQMALLSASWPKELHGLIPATAKQRQGRRILFKGLRVRMGVHDAQESDGVLVCQPHAVTGKMTYTGASEVIANELCELGDGGQVLVTKRVADWIRNNGNHLRIRCAVDALGQYNTSQVETAVDIYQVNPWSLRARKDLFSIDPRITSDASAA